MLLYFRFGQFCVYCYAMVTRVRDTQFILERLII